MISKSASAGTSSITRVSTPLRSRSKRVDEQQVRELRLVRDTRHSEAHRWCLQYGFWQHTGKRRLFRAFWEERFETEFQALQAKKKRELEIYLNPELQPAPEAEPPVQHVIGLRRFHNALRTDPQRTLRKALEDLPDPLPDIDALHKKMKLDPPSRHANSYQLYVHLRGPAYQLLLAMADAAGTTRSRIIEACLYYAGGGCAD